MCVSWGDSVVKFDSEIVTFLSKNVFLPCTRILSYSLLHTPMHAAHCLVKANQLLAQGLFQLSFLSSLTLLYSTYLSLCSFSTSSPWSCELNRNPEQCYQLWTFVFFCRRWGSIHVTRTQWRKGKLCFHPRFLSKQCIVCCCSFEKNLLKLRSQPVERTNCLQTTHPHPIHYITNLRALFIQSLIHR